MTDPANDATSVPRKRRRWIAVVAAGLSLLIGGWWLGSKNSVIARSRLIQVGQTRDEVIHLMGQPQLYSSTIGQNPTEGYGDMSMVELTARMLIDQYLGFDSLDVEESFPVEVEYDTERRVSRVHIRETTGR